MLFIVIIGLLLGCFSGLFLLDGFALFKDKPITLLNFAIGFFSTLIGLLMSYITICFITFVIYGNTGVGKTLLLLLGFKNLI